MWIVKVDQTIVIQENPSMKIAAAFDIQLEEFRDLVPAVEIDHIIRAENYNGKEDCRYHAIWI